MEPIKKEQLAAHNKKVLQGRLTTLLIKACKYLGFHLSEWSVDYDADGIPSLIWEDLNEVLQMVKKSDKPEEAVAIFMEYANLYKTAPALGVVLDREYEWFTHITQRN